MTITIKILRTGNDGNGYLLTTDNPQFPYLKKSILIDCGGRDFDYDLSDVGCICITHSHIDHVASLGNVLKTLNYEPILVINNAEFNSYVVQNSLMFCDTRKIKTMFLNFPYKNVSESVCVGNFVVTGICAYHDTEFPTHYFISDGETCVFVGCDTSHYNKETIDYVSQADGLIIEANYSEDVISTDILDGKPVSIVFSKSLKGRIIKNGHLSNKQTKKLLSYATKCKVICLTHINEIINSEKTINREIGLDRRIRVCINKWCPITTSCSGKNNSVFINNKR